MLAGRILTGAGRSGRIGLAVVCCLWPLEQGCATPGEVAQLTRVVKEVTISTPQGAARSGARGAHLPESAAVRTGPGSQAELTFADKTLARLGAQTVFGFNDGTRRMELRSGAMLVRAPRSARGAEITAATATVAVTGTTCLVEHNPGQYLKLVVLEGTARMFLKAHLGESVLVKEGQLLMFHLGSKVTALPNPVDVDIKRLLATSKLIQGFAPLGSESSIDQGIAEQKKQKSKGALVDTNLVIYGRGTMVSLVDPAANGGNRPSAAHPSPSPSPTAR